MYIYKYLGNKKSYYYNHYNCNHLMKVLGSIHCIYYSIHNHNWRIQLRQKLPDKWPKSTVFAIYSPSSIVNFYNMIFYNVKISSI